MSATMFFHVRAGGEIKINYSDPSQVTLTDNEQSDLHIFFAGQDQMRLLAEMILVEIGPKDSWNDVNNTAAAACGIEPEEPSSRGGSHENKDL